MSTVENDYKITDDYIPFVVPVYQNEKINFQYENELEFKSFEALVKTHGNFKYHKKYEHKIDESLRGQAVNLPEISYYYVCNNSGTKTIKQETNQGEPSNKKRRVTTNESIKKGCTAKFIKTIMANGRIKVQYKWRHENHEELKENYKALKKLLLKELDLPLKLQDNDDITAKNNQLELLVQNMKGFISTLQKARTPHQTRPPTQR